MIRRLLPIDRKASRAAVMTIGSANPCASLLRRLCCRSSACRREINPMVNAAIATMRQTMARTSAAVTVPYWCCVHTNIATQKKNSAATPAAAAAAAHAIAITAPSSLSFKSNMEDRRACCPRSACCRVYRRQVDPNRKPTPIATASTVMGRVRIASSMLSPRLSVISKTASVASWLFSVTTSSRPSRMR